MAITRTLETLRTNNHMHLFLARDCVKVAKQHLDENEHLTVMRIKLDEAVNMVLDGRINANSTAHLILRAARLLQKE